MFRRIDVGSIATNGFVAKLSFRGNNQIKNFMKNVQSVFLAQVFQANNVDSNLFSTAPVLQILKSVRSIWKLNKNQVFVLRQ